MVPMIANLSDQDLADISAFFATQVSTVEAADPDLADAGRRLYQAGDAARNIPSCMSCHGPGGRGNQLAAFPALGGQFAAYSAKQLRAYRDGSRTTDSGRHDAHDREPTHRRGHRGGLGVSFRALPAGELSPAPNAGRPRGGRPRRAVPDPGTRAARTAPCSAGISPSSHQEAPRMKTIVAALFGFALALPAAAQSDIEGLYQKLPAPQPTSDPDRGRGGRGVLVRLPALQRFQPYLEAWTETLPTTSGSCGCRPSSTTSGTSTPAPTTLRKRSGSWTSSTTSSSPRSTTRGEVSPPWKRSAASSSRTGWTRPTSTGTRSPSPSSPGSSVRFVMQSRYGLRGVPALIVNGRFLVSGATAGSYPNVLGVADAPRRPRAREGRRLNRLRPRRLPPGAAGPGRTDPVRTGPDRNPARTRLSPRSGSRCGR